MDWLLYVIYGVPALLLFIWHTRRRRRLEKRSAQVQKITGSAEPASLHPLIDPARCIGCGSCPEGVSRAGASHGARHVAGRAVLVSPATASVTACKAACPVEAISLVFGDDAAAWTIPLT
jgi:ferredoxin